MYSAISNFKRIEMYLRRFLGEYNKVTEEIDRALSAKRTKQETALLRSIWQECLELQKQSAKVVHGGGRWCRNCLTARYFS